MMNKLLLAIFLIIILFLFVRVTQNKKVRRSDQNAVFSVQKNEGGGVTITVKPIVLEIEKSPVFDVSFDTHSVELSFNPEEVSTLIDGRGKIYRKPVWKGTSGGGHHRSGTITFKEFLRKTPRVELIFTNVATIPERKFFWDIK